MTEHPERPPRVVQVSGWDGALTLYDVEKNELSTRCEAGEAPILDCCFADGTTAVSAGADRTVKLWDLAVGSSGKQTSRHISPVVCTGI